MQHKRVLAEAHGHTLRRSARSARCRCPWQWHMHSNGVVAAAAANVLLATAAQQGQGKCVHGAAPPWVSLP